MGVYPETFQDCPECPEMVVIPPGEFVMGSPESETGPHSDEGPQHTVRIERLFPLGKYEVTFAEWDGCVADGGCNVNLPDDRGWGRGQRPVMNVSWDDAKAYLRWVSRKAPKAYRLSSVASSPKRLMNWTTMGRPSSFQWRAPTWPARQWRWTGPGKPRS